MLPVEMNALRPAADRARDEYTEAHVLLLACVEAAYEGVHPWPTPAEYLRVAELGRVAATSLRHYLESAGVPSAPVASPAQRKHLIQRLARSERLWQPTPEAWLAQYDKGGGR